MQQVRRERKKDQRSLNPHSHHDPFCRSRDVRTGDQILVSRDQHSEQLTRRHFEGNVDEIFLREGGSVAFGHNSGMYVAGSVDYGGGCDDENWIVTVRFECFELRRGRQALGLIHFEVVGRTCHES